MPTLATAAIAAPPEAQSSGRILIVDDLADNRDILARRFQRRKFETVEARDGHEALRLVEERAFDVVLLDVMMPDICGLEVLQKIRERHSPSALPVVMVTAKGRAEDVVQALDLGANDYVTKPIDFPIVLARVTTQIERRRAALALEASNATLRDTKDDLERTLVERNARLLAANARLQEEIARRLEADSKSAFLAYHDSLTGLANRHACDGRLPDLLSEACAAGTRLAVLFVDLDGFKNVNDALGHTIGDALIKQVATAMLDTIGHADFIARIGGDEFCIVHASAAPEVSAGALADRLIAMIGEARVIDGHEVFVGASVGIAIADPTAGDEASELLKRADLAMYRAKADGRGVWRLFEPELGESQRQRHTLELELRGALQRAEFDLYFQPIIDLRQGRISCFEALLRWDRRPSGPAAPDTFIPLAEETGLIAPIGEWVLRRACEEAARWPADIRVAVNVSPVQFRGKQILASLVGALAGSGLSPGRLELELTESVLLHKSEENLQTLQECRALGVRLAMDDFGTGYSSLGYFRSFRFDKVKIDRSFVSGAAMHGDDGAVVRAVVGLGKSFGMTTTAEGVETDEQLAYLRDEGCCEVQGFLFGRAEPAANVADMIERCGTWLRSQ